MSNLKFHILDHIREESLEIALIRKRRRRNYGEYNVNDLVFDVNEAHRKEAFSKAYDDMVRNVKRCVAHEDAPEEAICMLRSFRKILSMDLAYSHLARFAYEKDPGSVNVSLPYFYYDEMGKRIDLTETIEDITLKDKYVVEHPYSPQKWKNHLQNHFKNKEPLDPEKYTESLPYYYPGLSLIVQGGGCIHRTAEAFVHEREGKARVRLVTDEPLYENIETNGAIWIDRYNGKKIADINDYRIAVIFTIKCWETNLEKRL